MKKLVAEFIGTLWLVLGGCGSAVLAAAYPELGIGFVGVAIAFGLMLIHLISIPVTNTSANPTRGTSQAILAGLVYKFISPEIND